MENPGGSSEAIAERTESRQALEETSKALQDSESVTEAIPAQPSLTTISSAQPSQNPVDANTVEPTIPVSPVNPEPPAVPAFSNGVSRSRFQSSPDDVPTAEKRKQFVHDFTEHLNDLLGYIGSLETTTMKDLEFRVFGKELNEAQRDEAEERLKKHIIALKKANTDNVLTNAVATAAQATLAEAAAYFRLRECISAVRMAMKWEDRIRKYISLAHLGYAKHVIRKLGPVFEILDQCVIAIPLIWQPITEIPIARSALIGPHAPPRDTSPGANIQLTEIMKTLKVDGAENRSRRRKRPKTKKNPVTREDQRLALPASASNAAQIPTHAAGMRPDKSENKKSKPGHSDKKKTKKRRKEAGMDRDPSQEPTKSSLIKQAAKSAPQVPAGDPAQVLMDESVPPGESTSVLNVDATDAGRRRHFSFSDRRGSVPPMDIIARPSSSSDQDPMDIETPEVAQMRVIEAQLHYFQLICSKFLQKLMEITERLKDPSEVWYKDTQFENLFRNKFESIARMLPDQYLLKPLGAVRNKLENTIRDFSQLTRD